MSNKYLIHHGIKGMHWGVRRYQNYDGTLKHPKGRKGSGNSSNKQGTEKQKKKGLTDSQKKAIKIGAAITAGVLLTAGGIYLAKKHGLIQNGRKVVMESIEGGKKPMPKLSDMNFDYNKGEYILPGQGGGFTKKVFKDLTIGQQANNAGNILSSVSTARLKSINSGRDDPMGRTMNCAHTSVSYILNSMFGYECDAKPFTNLVDEKSGMVMTGGRDKAVFGAIFDNMNVRSGLSVEMHNLSSGIPNKTSGIMRITNFQNGHFICYNKDSNGVLKFVDAQSGKVVNPEFFVGCVATDIFDLSNSSIKNGAESVLKHFIS